jgi:hypothetical protein
VTSADFWPGSASVSAGTITVGGYITNLTQYKGLAGTGFNFDGTVLDHQEGGAAAAEWAACGGQCRVSVVCRGLAADVREHVSPMGAECGNPKMPLEPTIPLVPNLGFWNARITGNRAEQDSLPRQPEGRPWRRPAPVLRGEGLSPANQVRSPGKNFRK